MMTREQLRKAWMNAQEINYNGNTLLVVQGFDIEGYALFGYEKPLFYSSGAMKMYIKQ